MVSTRLEFFGLLVANKLTMIVNLLLKPTGLCFNMNWAY